MHLHNFNFRIWYKVEIRFSDNSTKGDNRRHHLTQEKKVCNLQIQYHFWYKTCGPINGVKNQLLAEGYL